MQTNSPETTRIPRVTLPRTNPDEIGGRVTYVGDNFSGDATMTSGGTPVLAQDGEPAGLARVTLAMRKPATPDEPAPRRLIGLCLWAAAVGILGCVVALRAAVVALVGTSGWFLPTASAIGLIGTACTIGAFVVARQRIVPWALLGTATCALGIATIVTSMA